MAKYRKKPVVIEACQYAGTLFDKTRIDHWMDGGDCPGIGHVADFYAPKGMPIETLEGTMIASPGDWIIKGICGEFYPCKPDIFEETYELVK